jgi:hypothetical protein
VACELIRGRVGNRFVSRQLAWNTGRTFMFPPGFVFGLSRREVLEMNVWIATMILALVVFCVMAGSILYFAHKG